MLILGEPGSGRSTLARALHGASPRAAGPLIEVDPGSIPSTLFESEFFGYRAGAFTGADAARARGGWPAPRGARSSSTTSRSCRSPSQPKLLRLVAERRYAPLGGAEVEADVRFVAIGSEDLPRRVARETFRPDLFYRLEVLAFRLPPLRERRADLPRAARRPPGRPRRALRRPRPELAAAAPAPGCWSTPGRATCGSSATPWSGA